MSDIFDKLKKIEQNDISWFNSLDAKDKNEMTSIVMQRWLYGTNDPNQILLLNECNKLIWKFNVDNKNIIFSLLAASITRKNQRYKWIKMPKRKSNVIVEHISDVYNCSLYEAQSILPLFTQQELDTIEDNLGIN